MKTTNKKPHYAWVILVACCLFQGGTAGLVANCGGIFYNPVCQDLGFEVSAFTLYLIFHGVMGFLALPFTSKLLKTIPARFALILMGLIYGGCTVAMSRMSTLPGFYLVGTLQGIAGSLLMCFVSPLLINNWFEKSYGFAMGLFGAFSGLSGVLFNPLLTAVIEARGWRTGYLVQGLLCLACVLPASLLVRALEPAELGMERYGQGESGGQTAVTAQDGPATALEKKLLVYAVIFALCSAVTAGYAQHYSKYASTIGLTPAVGALLVSATMAGNIAGKFGQGMLRDKIGTKPTLILMGCLMAASYSLMLITSPCVLYPAAAVSGLSMAMATLGIPMFVKHLFGAERYQKFGMICSSIMSLMGSVAITIVSLLYEIRYSYTPVLLIGSGICLLGVVTVLLADREKRRSEAV